MSTWCGAESHQQHDHELVSEYVSTHSPRIFPRVLESTHVSLSRTLPILPASAQYQTATASLVGLRALVAKIHLPDEGLDQFLTILREAVVDVGTTNPELLRLVLPYREYIQGEEGLSTLRRNLDRIQLQNTDAQSCDAS